MNVADVVDTLDWPEPTKCPSFQKSFFNTPVALVRMMLCLRGSKLLLLYLLVFILVQNPEI